MPLARVQTPNRRGSQMSTRKPPLLLPAPRSTRAGTALPPPPGPPAPASGASRRRSGGDRPQEARRRDRKPGRDGSGRRSRPRRRCRRPRATPLAEADVSSRLRCRRDPARTAMRRWGAVRATSRGHVATRVGISGSSAAPSSVRTWGSVRLTLARSPASIVSHVDVAGAAVCAMRRHRPPSPSE